MPCPRAAEREVARWYGDRDVDPDHGDVHFQLEAASRSAVGGEDRGAVGVLVTVDHRHSFVERRGTDDTEHRPEDLLAVDRHLGRYVVEEGHAQEVPVWVLGHVEAPAVVD